MLFMIFSFGKNARGISHGKIAQCIYIPPRGGGRAISTQYGMQQAPKKAPPCFARVFASFTKNIKTPREPPEGGVQMLYQRSKHLFNALLISFFQNEIARCHAHLRFNIFAPQLLELSIQKASSWSYDMSFAPENCT